MTKFYACRPDGLFHIGDYYYPEGNPEGSSNCDFEKTHYLDENGNPFWICYTTNQFKLNIKDNFGLFFAPFIPLIVSKPINNI